MLPNPNVILIYKFLSVRREYEIMLLGYDSIDDLDDQEIIDHELRDYHKDTRDKDYDDWLSLIYGNKD